MSNTDDFTRSIPKEEIIEWLMHPTTKSVFKVLNEQKTSLEDSVLNGGTLVFNSAEETAMRTTMRLGRIQGLNQILNILIEES